MTGNETIYNCSYNQRFPDSTKNFSCLNPHFHVKKDICMIKSGSHILVILQMFP